MSDIVLDTSLLRQFFLFYGHNPSYDEKIVTRLFSRLRPFLCTLQQLRQCGIPHAALPAITATKGYWRIHPLQDLPEDENELYRRLAEHARFRMLLALEDKNIGIVSINLLKDDDPLQLSYAGRYRHDQARERALLHLRHLVESAQQSVEIHDLYMDINLVDLLQQLLKNCHCRILCFTGKDRQKALKKALKVKGIDATVREYDGRRAHDRYIIIDNQLEILLSSGMKYVQDTSKDFTYIIRDKS